VPVLLVVSLEQPQQTEWPVVAFFCPILCRLLRWQLGLMVARWSRSVKLRRARLVLGWVSIVGRANHLVM